MIKSKPYFDARSRTYVVAGSVIMSIRLKLIHRERIPYSAVHRIRSWQVTFRRLLLSYLLIGALGVLAYVLTGLFNLLIVLNRSGNWVEAGSRIVELSSLFLVACALICAIIVGDLQFPEVAISNDMYMLQGFFVRTKWLMRPESASTRQLPRRFVVIREDSLPGILRVLGYSYLIGGKAFLLHPRIEERDRLLGFFLGDQFVSGAERSKDSTKR